MASIVLSFFSNCSIIVLNISVEIEFEFVASIDEFA
jgi:hypothetical protein